MKDVMLTLLQFALILAVPVLVVFICRLLNAKRHEIQTDGIMNETAFIFDRACETISAIVACVGQTYVDELKKNGTFSTEKQKQALDRAYRMAREMISQASQDFISEACGSFSDWACTMIEKEVRDQKYIQPFEIESGNPCGFCAEPDDEEENGDAGDEDSDICEDHPPDEGTGPDDEPDEMDE